MVGSQGNSQIQKGGGLFIAKFLCVSENRALQKLSFRGGRRVESTLCDIKP